MKNRVLVFALLSVWLLPLASCTENQNQITIVPPPPSYKFLKNKDDVLFNLQKAYNERNDIQYAKILDQNFTFFFSQSDIDDPDINVPTEWHKAREITSANNMFNGFAPPNQPELQITDIKLYLTYTTGENEWARDPGTPTNHPGEDWFSKTVTYNMTIDLAGPDTFQSTHINASFLIRFAEVNGDSIWQIVVWRDDVLSALSQTSQAPTGTNETTWGRIKTLYGTAGAPPGASPVAESTWGSIKSLY